MNKTLNISASPHLRNPITTGRIMLLVICALLPTTIFGIINFHYEQAWRLVLITTVSAVITEYLYQKLRKRESTIKDGTALVTGLLLSLSLPPTLPLWMGALGAFFSILVVKQLFGGVGRNYLNPALSGRVFLALLFGNAMHTFVHNGEVSLPPLCQLEQGEALEPFFMIIGNVPGTIGETSIVAILVGAVFLLATKTIRLRIPGSFLVSFSIFILIFGQPTLDFTLHYLVAHLTSGGLMLGVWFMATDYGTTPVSKYSQVFYGILLGIFTGIFRIIDSFPEGVAYAILLGNLVVPLLNRLTLLRWEMNYRKKAEHTIAKH